jgi:SOS-response transcriptional repressor LexA
MGIGAPWTKRLKQIIDETPGLTMKSLSLKSGLNKGAVFDIVKRGQDPSVATVLAICRSLGLSPADLLGGTDRDKISIPVVGIVSAGEGWTPIDDNAHDPVDFELGAHDTIAVEVRGDSMTPVYRNGDVLICQRQFGPHADNLIGLDCVIRTSKGEHYVKILRRGSRPNRFNLRSYNSAVDDIEDVALAWIAPVSWIKRQAR